jgi:hypothetical protein
MAAGIPARLTPAQGRRFGLTVGAAFLVLAAITWWRDYPTATAVLGSIGSLLAAGGLIVPQHLGPVERAWMRMAVAISKVTTPIVMGIMYLLVLTPTGYLRRAFGGNPLVHEPEEASYWKRRPEGERAGNLSRQY